MSNDGTPDDQIGEALLIRESPRTTQTQERNLRYTKRFSGMILTLIRLTHLTHLTLDVCGRVVQDQMMNITTGGNVRLPLLPEVQPLHNLQHQKLLDQLALSVRVIGDQLNNEQNFNHQIDGLARLGDKKIFSKLVEGVFDDGQINWGRIIVLFFAVGKLAVKMVLANLPEVFSEILDSCLDFFRTKLLAWIRNMGGWISSISALTQFSIERITASYIRFEHLIAFVCGIMLGSAIVWKLSRSS